MMPQTEVRTPGARRASAFTFNSSTRQGDPGGGGTGTKRPKPAKKKAAAKKPAKKK